MNKDSSFSKNLREDTQKSEKKYKAFRDISKYFSKKEWAKLSHSEKITYVYLKRNYTTMTSLGLRATLPAFMSSNGQIIESQSDDSDECRNHGSQVKKVPKKPATEENDPKGVPKAVGSEQAQRQLYPLGKAYHSLWHPTFNLFPILGPRKKNVNIWSHRLRERKYLVAYEEISDPEEED
ncbi:protein SSXA1-like [Marmota marmota marmota]|uniref:protein SSXA1-like n=1 Tax=Marmota marmota marmota TaxID=9994 RepID=UPI002092E652|nr:protein SSXA1-like [Marmota marmota marmota]